MMRDCGVTPAVCHSWLVIYERAGIRDGVSMKCEALCLCRGGETAGQMRLSLHRYEVRAGTTISR